MECDVMGLRLDKALLLRGLVPTRSRARDLIVRGAVSVGGAVQLKPGAVVADDAPILLSEASDYVSRGSMKLEAALAEFGFHPAGRVALDIGASTGGFTDLLLQRGANHVFAVDVGHGQLHHRLRDDARVTCLEGMDARALTARELPQSVTAVVADVSFISLEKALPAALALAQPGSWLVALVKPQFEAGPQAIGKGGIVRDAVVRDAQAERIAGWVGSLPGWRVSGVVASPIEGGSGNQEFLLGRFSMGEGTDLTIEKLGAKGDGIAMRAGETVYVPFALPGERWRIGPQHGPPERDAVRLTDSPDRADPVCRHFLQCGGCLAQHMSPEIYRDWKHGLVVEAFRHRGIAADVAPVAVVDGNSRRRAFLGVERRGADVILGFRQEGQHTLVDLAECPVLDPLIVAAVPGLRALARRVMPDRAGGRMVVTKLDHGLDVSFDNGRKDLLPNEKSELGVLAQKMGLARLTVAGELIVARARAVVTIDGVEVEISPGLFLQAVPQAERLLADLCVAALPKRAKKVADLFSGVGTLTLPLARRAAVTAYDSDKRAIAALDGAVRHATGLKPVTTTVRDLYRDPLSVRELAEFDAVVFDPPRAGAAEQAERLAKSKVPVVIAVSCNPGTLARDARTLIDGGYKMGPVTPIDQFLFSAHIEAVTVFRR